MKFKRGTDPLKAMGLSYGNKPKTNAWKILEFIGSKGEDGAGLTEIQEYIYTVLQGNSDEEFRKTSGESYPPKGWRRETYGKLRATRGYYTTALYGGSNNSGLLYKYCQKNPITKKWVLQRMPNPGESIYEEQSNKLVPETLNEMFNKKNRYIK